MSVALRHHLLPGIGLPLGAVLEGAAIGTEALATSLEVGAAVVGATGDARDCRDNFLTTQCATDIAATGAGAAGLGFRVAGRIGLVGKDLVEASDFGLGVNSTGLGIIGVGASLTAQSPANSPPASSAPVAQNQGC